MDFISLKPPMSLSQDERVKQLHANQELALGMIEHVRNGGSVIDIAKILDVSYSSLMRLIRYKKEWADSYDQALKDRSEFTREQILGGIRNLAEADITKLYDTEGRLLPVHKWPKDVAAAVVGIDSKGNVKLESKSKNYELLGKTEAMFVEKTENKSIDSLAAVIAQTYGKPMPSDSNG